MITIKLTMHQVLWIFW